MKHRIKTKMHYKHRGRPTSPSMYIFKTVTYTNGSMIGHFLPATNTSAQQAHYDAHGAMYYILAIVFLYGCSILMMIASFVKKAPPDNTIIKYMKDSEKLNRLQRKQEKFRTELQMHQKKVHRILGPDRAEVLDENTYCSSTPSPSMSRHETIFDWDFTNRAFADRRLSGSSIATTIVCAEDLQSLDSPFLESTSTQNLYEGETFLSPTLPSRLLHTVSCDKVNETECSNDREQKETTEEEYSVLSVDNKCLDNGQIIPQVRIYTC